MNHLLRGPLSSRTVESYSAIWESIQLFIIQRLHGKINLPLSEEYIVKYIAYMFQLGRAVSTIRSHMSVISFVHHIRSIPDPTASFIIKHVLVGFERLSKPPNRKLGINHAILVRLINELHKVVDNNYERILLKAICCVAYYGCFRIGELVVSRGNSSHTVITDNIDKVMTGKICKCIKVHLDSYKFSHGKQKNIYLHRQPDDITCPINSMLEYSEIRESDSPLLFVYENGFPVTRDWVSQRIKAVMSILDFDSCHYDTHSFRVGRCMDLAEAGLSILQIREKGRWESFAFLKYLRSDNIHM